MTISNFDALLVLSFGGPEGEEEVIPFLENVTRGRDIPKERLAQVGEHYFHFGGVSPINQQNKQIIANIEQVLNCRGYDLPVYFGNRNWHPFGEDAVKQMREDGHRNVLVFATSAWGGYSACRQYDEDIQRLMNVTPELQFTKLWQFYAHPTFIKLLAEKVKESWDHLTESERAATKVLFTAHSVPNAADDASGGSEDANLYSRQVAEASRLVAEQAGIDDYEVVWQSRSGNPATPWLEPDIVDRTLELKQERDFEHLICVPIGFITDHMEVVWDLDTELQQACDEHGITLDRVPTVGLEPEFAAMVVELIENVAHEARPAALTDLTVQGCTVNGAPCHPDCCAPVKRPSRPNASAM